MLHNLFKELQLSHIIEINVSHIYLRDLNLSHILALWKAFFSSHQFLLATLYAGVFIFLTCYFKIDYLCSP